MPTTPMPHEILHTELQHFILRFLLVYEIFHSELQHFILRFIKMSLLCGYH